MPFALAEASSGEAPGSGTNASEEMSPELVAWVGFPTKQALSPLRGHDDPVFQREKELPVDVASRSPRYATAYVGPRLGGIRISGLGTRAEPPGGPFQTSAPALTAADATRPPAPTARSVIRGLADLTSVGLSPPIVIARGSSGSSGHNFTNASSPPEAIMLLSGLTATPFTPALLCVRGGPKARPVLTSHVVTFQSALPDTRTESRAANASEVTGAAVLRKLVLPFTLSQR